MYMTGWIAMGPRRPASIDDDALLDLAHAQDADVRLVDDRPAEQVSLDARVRDAEGRAAQVVDRDLPGPGALRDVVDRANDAADPELVGPADDRHDEAVRRVDGDADVDVLQDDERVVEHAGVHLRVLAERARRRHDREREHRQAHPLGLVALLVRLAQLARLVHVDLGHGDDVGRGELRVRHVVGRDAPTPREGDDLVPVARACTPGTLNAPKPTPGMGGTKPPPLLMSCAICCVCGVARVCGGSMAGGGVDGRSLRRRRRAGSAQHVVPRHAAALAGALDALEVDVVLERGAAHGRAWPSGVARARRCRRPRRTVGQRAGGGEAMPRRRQRYRGRRAPRRATRSSSRRRPLRSARSPS